MPLFIKNCFIYKIYETLISLPYKKSLLKKTGEKLLYFFKQSYIFENFSKYINKNPYFLTSTSRKIFQLFINLINKIMDFLHKILKKIIVPSAFFAEIKDIHNMNIENKLLFISILIGSLNFGYILSGMFFGTLNSNISTVLLIMCIVLPIFSKNIDSVKQSYIFKLFKYLF